MSQSFEIPEVFDNKKNHRFEINLNGELAIIPYNFKDDMIGLFHTQVPEAFKGKGVASKLTLYALNYAKDHNLQILPYCPFIAKYIHEHPEWQVYVKRFPSR